MRSVGAWLDELEPVVFRAFRVFSLVNGILGLLLIEIWGLSKLWGVITRS
jgi:hypothetical protein